MSSSTRSRRTQAQRSASTQERLLRATIGCWSEFGYAHTSTALITRRAGVTRGALNHHYPSRDELATAAVGYLVARWSADLAAVFAHGELPISRQLDRLWDLHQGPICAAMIDMVIAARTDPALGGHRESVRACRRTSEAVTHDPSAPSGPTSVSFPPWADIALDTMCGLLLRTLGSDDPAAARQACWPALRRQLIAMIDARSRSGVLADS
ncbi:TetR/AcrR family transcriptional regulator [Nocardia asteroides]|uniref:TetR/AcrR family transcriptional regulator n=1 Tax=Nocardia asteroides TaxID=1824 RepID=UPI0033E5C750